MDGVQALHFKAGRRPATSWVNAVWTAYAVDIINSQENY